MSSMEDTLRLVISVVGKDKLDDEGHYGIA